MKKNELIWLGIIACFAYYFYHLYESGEIKLFIHPRMYNLGYFALIVFVIFIVVQLKRLVFNKGEAKLKKGYIIFILPIVLVLVVQPKSLDTQLVVAGEVDLLAQSAFGTNATIAVAAQPDLEKTTLDDSSSDGICESYEFSQEDSREELNEIAGEANGEMIDDALFSTGEAELNGEEIEENDQQIVDVLEQEELTGVAEQIQESETEEVAEDTPTYATDGEEENSTALNNQEEVATVDGPAEEELVEEQLPEEELSQDQETPIEETPIEETIVESATSVSASLYNDELAENGFETESDQYFEILRMSYEELDNLEGETIELIVFVSHIDGLESNQFYGGRLIITCCASCAQVDGFICENNIGASTQDGDWLVVTGVVETTDYYSEYMDAYVRLPLIQLTAVNHIDEPSEPYVYFIW